MLFTSGQIAIDPTTGIYTPSDIADEARTVMQHLQTLLHAAGMDFGHVVKTSIFLADMNDFAIVNEVYAGFFTSHFPARETVQVSVLPKHAKVEISMIASL
jgi:2-iminobutanoate/2-iminopropanoate deaminase